ncbi:MAG: hypothetical protein COB26_06490, partial [Piscirickettsiaceae bacterium]
ALLYRSHFNVNANKVASIALIVRTGADKVIAPFNTASIPLLAGVLSGFHYFSSQFPFGPVPEKSDLWLIGSFGTQR